MFNYHNLNDIEFEELCKDIMEKLLNTGLRIFAKGRDGGVDLTDSTVTHKIVVQVKHYINSKFSDLITTLKKEVGKVNSLKPNQYYICCGMNLTDSNISEIYSIFSNYMDSDRNIITLKEVDEFLQKPENSDIVRKHYKLWLYASNILSEIYNQDIFIDCESLLSDVNEECKYFVQTASYEECLKCLENNRIIMMIGAPGVGKTVTSKMLIFYFASQKFRVRYTTNGDISNVKRSLSGNSDLKEVVLLDDCLGQHYFNMKDSQENELMSLIKYIKMNPNKMLILNSRITIYNEAKERSEEFGIFLQGDKIKIHTINMDLTSLVEKAKIFYNHLVFKNVPKEYYNNIRKDKNYLKIVNHLNYTPRIIEYITNSSRYITVPPENYSNYILETLLHPDDIWKNEFERRLQNIDRAFMNTLYSLTDKSIDCEILKNCFNYRLSQMNDIDNTVNNYELTLARLNKSIVSIFDNKGKKQIGVMNPSINDYLKLVFEKNILELSAVRKAILYYIQLERCYSNNELEEILKKNVMDGSILNVQFNDDIEKENFIISKVCQYEVKNELYKSMIIQYLNNGYDISHKGLLSKNRVVTSLSEEPLCSFYNFKELVCNKDIVNNIFSVMTFEELINTVNTINIFLQLNTSALKWFVPLCVNCISAALDDQIDSIEVSSYCENYDIRDVVEQHTSRNEWDFEFDHDGAVETIEQFLEEDIKDDLKEMIADLPMTIRNKLDIENKSIDGKRTEIEGVIESFFEPDFDYDDYRDNHSGSSSTNKGDLDIIDAIFDRD